MFVIKHKNIFIGIISLIMLVAIVLTFAWKPNLSIEFTGGSVVRGEFKDARPTTETINSYMASFITNNKIADFKIQPVGGKGIIVRTRDLTQEEHGSLIGLLSDGTNIFTESSFSTIGPSVGSELRSKAIISIALVLVLIIFFVAYAFRSASRVVSSWKFGLSVIFCLVHDIFVPTGIFVILSHYIIGYEIDTLFVTALLAILGYSVADTIVVFDRIRENLKFASSKEIFEDVVGKSLRETYVRSINTSLTTVLASLAIFFFGGEATKHFALMLAIGITVGTYSSILLASPLLVLISGKAQRKP
ncbi:MAG TPA: protein translocase subunit SecF [Candidatus Paceibacterota bacterium]